jgi:transposase
VLFPSDTSSALDFDPYWRKSRALNAVINPRTQAILLVEPVAEAAAKRIFERLRDEHGFSGGYTVVRDYVRLARTCSREVFIPLAHPPGPAQVDFGECVAFIGGVRMKLHVFCFDLPHSDACFIKAYAAETTEGSSAAMSRLLRFLAVSCRPRCKRPDRAPCIAPLPIPLSRRDSYLARAWS